MKELANDEFGAAGTEERTAEVERGAFVFAPERVEADERVSLGDFCAGGFHPADGFGRVTENDVGFVFLEPRFELGASDGLHAERGHGGGFGKVFLEGEEGAFPAEVEAFVVRDLHEEARAAIAASVEFLEESDHGAVVIGADAVEWRMVDEVVGVNGGVARPRKRREVGKAGSGQNDDALDAARVEDCIQSVETDALRTDLEALDLEAEFIGAFGDTGEEGFVVADGVGWAAGFDDFEGGEDAAELLSARAAEQRHHGAGEGIAFVAGGFSGGADACDGVGIDTGRAAKRVGNGGAGETEGASERAQSGGGHGEVVRGNFGRARGSSMEIRRVRILPETGGLALTLTFELSP